MAGSVEPGRRGTPRRSSPQQSSTDPVTGQARLGPALWRHPLFAEGAQGATGRHALRRDSSIPSGPGRARLSWEGEQPGKAHCGSKDLRNSTCREPEGKTQQGHVVRVEVEGVSLAHHVPPVALGALKRSALRQDLRRLGVCCCLLAICLLPLPREVQDRMDRGTERIKLAVWEGVAGRAGRAPQKLWAAQSAREAQGPLTVVRDPRPSTQPAAPVAPLERTQPSVAVSTQGLAKNADIPNIQPAARGVVGPTGIRPGPASGKLPAMQQVAQPGQKQAPLRPKLLASDALPQTTRPAQSGAIANSSGPAQERGATAPAATPQGPAQNLPTGNATAHSVQGPKKPIWLKPQREEGDPPPMFPPFKPGVPWWWQGIEEEVERRLFGEGRRYYRPEGVWGHDWCAGEGHFKWSFTCIAAEAKYLDRVLVLNTDLCLIPLHNRGKEARPPLAAFYNLTTLAMHQPFVPESIFLHALDKFQRKQAQQEAGAPKPPQQGSAGLPAAMVLEVGLEPSSEDLKKATNATLIVRDVGPTGYGFSICSKPNSPLERDWGLLEMVRPLGEIANQISGAMHWDHDAVHVRRGDKLDPRGWPHLDNDTQAPALLEKLPRFIQPGRDVYISTNEYKPGFFDALKSKYKVHLLTDYSYLWNTTSAWYKWAKTIMKEPDFNGRMQAIVDYAIFSRGRKKVETFNDLTTDKRHGSWATR